MKIFNPLTKLKEKHYKLGYQEGTKNSFDIGYEKGLQQGIKESQEQLNYLYDLFECILRHGLYFHN